MGFFGGVFFFFAKANLSLRSKLNIPILNVI